MRISPSNRVIEIIIFYGYFCLRYIPLLIGKEFKSMEAASTRK